MDRQYEQEFFDFIKGGTSPYHVVKKCTKMLENAGFEQLKLNCAWQLNNGKGYYVVCHDSGLFAFRLGKKMNYRQGTRIAAAHGDFPGLRIKAKPELREEGYRKLNVEIYGGAILNTWLDRPLSIAGRVALRSEDAFHPELRFVDFKRPVLTIPNMPIHINRDVNKGVELNRQTDMLPICGMEGKDEEKETFFTKLLAKELQVEEKEILDYELTVYNTDEPQKIGFEEEFISSPRLDNLTSVFALMKSMTGCEREQGVNLAAIFDHEEIGSRTKLGAGSKLLSYIFEKIYTSLGKDRMENIELLDDSMLLSVDVSHALHPNQKDKYDLTNKPVLNGGICIKEACSQSYATDSEAIAVVQQLCEKSGAAYQKAVNRSDGTGGSTLGTIAGTMLPINTADIGIGLLAMHSSREIMGVSDQEQLQKLIDAFYKSRK